MARYRLTESELQNIIYSTINETLKDKIIGGTKKGLELMKDKCNKVGDSLKDLINYDKFSDTMKRLTDDSIIDNQFNKDYVFRDDEDEEMNESIIRDMIREAVAGYLNEYYNPDTGTYGDEREIRTGRGNTYRLDKNDPLDKFNLEKDTKNNKRFNLQKENRLRDMIREAVKSALREPTVSIRHK